MTGLAAGTVETTQHVTVNDHTGANAGAQRSHDHIFAAGTAAFPVFTQSGHIGIVAGFDI